MILWAALAVAAPRYALVIGANRGDASEAPLRWAEEDALRMAATLTTLGGVDPGDLVALRGADANGVRAALTRLGARVRAEGAAEAELVVYYSGHADAEDLHLAGSRLPLSELKAAVGATAARTRVIVIDACRAGSLTRKGARPAAPFTIVAEDRLSTDGLAIVTSAAAGEDAQESESLRGGVFTHHLLAGLEGAADQSGDARVTLTEAYQYSYARTVATTSGAPTLQHPSFSWDLRGQSDLVLTRLDDTARGAWLQVDTAGEYLVLDAHGTALVREAALAAQGRLALPAGRYRVRLRTPARLSEADITTTAGQVVELRAADLVAVPLGQAARRGGPARPAVALELSGDVRAPLLDAWSPAPGGNVGARVDLPALTLRVRATFDQASAEGDTLEGTMTAWGAEAGALKLADLGRFSIGAGVMLGGGVITQSFVTDGIAPAREATALRAGPVLHAEWSPVDRFFVTLEGGLDTVVLPTESTPTGRVVPHASLGVGVWVR